MSTRRSVAAACIAGTLALPAAASAMPIDNGRPAPRKTTDAPPPAARTIAPTIRFPIALAGAALVVALSSAGYSAIRLAPLRAARSES